MAFLTRRKAIVVVFKIGVNPVKKPKLWSGNLLSDIAEVAEVPIEVARPIVSAFIRVLSEELANGYSVAFKDIGTFYVRERRDKRDRVLFRKLELKPARRLMKALHLYDFWSRPEWLG